MTDFQRNAANKISHVGGSIYFQDDKSWRDGHGNRLFVPSGDFKTEGFIGWPTVRALMDAGVLHQTGGSKYSLSHTS